MSFRRGAGGAPSLEFGAQVPSRGAEFQGMEDESPCFTRFRAPKLYGGLQFEPCRRSSRNHFDSDHIGGGELDGGSLAAIKEPSFFEPDQAQIPESMSPV